MIRSLLTSSPRARSWKLRRASVILIVLWAISVAALVTTGVQLFSHRQATLGREALERIQARWAARAGMEHTLAVMRDYTERPVEDDAFAMTRDMEAVATGSTINASYDIVHHSNGRNFLGPLDEHSRFNLNRGATNPSERAVLMALEYMTLDIVDAVGDWLDENDDPSTFGVERDWYLNQRIPYEPRNGALHNNAEFELIAGVWPQYFRGEDWNLNNRLDPSENDGDLSPPEDGADDILDAGWAANLTTWSRSLGATGSGEKRLRLKDATAEELVERLEIDEPEAQALIAFGKNPQNRLEALLTQPLNSNGTIGGATTTTAGTRGRTGSATATPGQEQQQPITFTSQELRRVLAETCIEDPLEKLPGKMNLNTIPAAFLRDIIDLIGYDESVADEILFLRDSRPQGITSIVDLQGIPEISASVLDGLTARFDTYSNVYTITSRGRAAGSGLEVEIIAVVDRSTVPVRILEYREQ